MWTQEMQAREVYSLWKRNSRQRPGIRLENSLEVDRRIMHHDQELTCKPTCIRYQIATFHHRSITYMWNSQRLQTTACFKVFHWSQSAQTRLSYHHYTHLSVESEHPLREYDQSASLNWRDKGKKLTIEDSTEPVNNLDPPFQVLFWPSFWRLCTIAAYPPYAGSGAEYEHCNCCVPSKMFSPIDRWFTGLDPTQ